MGEGGRGMGKEEVWMGRNGQATYGKGRKSEVRKEKDMEKVK